jgi:hypothetical protein
MTDQQRSRFLGRFSEEYDLPRAAAAAGIGRGEAYALLKTAADEVDRLVLQRLNDRLLAAIRREYEAMAFGDAEEVRPGDRIRALEQLRGFAQAERGGAASPSVTVRYEYV